eukprot:TRINITY_DN5862_c0_g3_i1.p1 TRINITY_DN5862_c0_g3~~TRINITY_DN5862_c0_g3_i1.p1  ORF type:complete len:530 (-),score=85.59 TRINITY_DN5862_c0_g3_i1:1457-2980(-)
MRAVQIFRGTVIHTPSSLPPISLRKANRNHEHVNSGTVPTLDCTLEGLEVLEDHCIGVTAEGTIAFVKPSSQCSEMLDDETVTVRTLPPKQFIIPGFVDIHVHAPQFAYTGTATDRPLMEWLKDYTFPHEAKMDDVAYARRVYRRLVRRLLSTGTTTAQYFATLHVDASLALRDVMERLGQRGLVGRVNMDVAVGSSDFVEASATSSLEETQRFLDAFNRPASTSSPHHHLVLPVLTPRFVTSCSLEQLRGLGEMKKNWKGLHIQTHAAESTDTVQFVRKKHWGRAGAADGDVSSSRDIGILDECGLLEPPCTLAHCVHINDDEIRLLSEKGTGIAHCALSNFYFGDGLFPLEKVLLGGVRVGLGTDIAGGYSPSMLSAIRNTVIASKAREHDPRYVTSSSSFVNFVDALWLATMGGAQVLNLDQRIGSIEEGKSFDAIVVSVGGRDPSDDEDEDDDLLASPIDVFKGDSVVDCLQKFLHLGDDRNLAEVYVQGRLVGGALQHQGKS